MSTLAMFDAAKLVGGLIIDAMGAGGLVCLIMCFKTRGLARWGAGLLGILLFVGAYYLAEVSDPYVRSPIPAEKLAGTFYLRQDWSSEVLTQLHCQDCKGRLTLAPDGTFTAKDIPASCFYSPTFPGDTSAHSLDFIHREGFYDAWGNWRSSHVSVAYVTLNIREYQFWPLHGQETGFPRESTSFAFNAYLKKGKPLSLGFRAGEEYDFMLLFSKQ